MHPNDLRAALALRGMGIDWLPAEALTYTDLLVAAVNMLHPEIVAEAISVTRESGEAHLIKAADVISTISAVCSQNEGVRDTEDLIWTMRSGSDPAMGQKERDIWAFAVEWGKQVRNKLIDIIAAL